MRRGCTYYQPIDTRYVTTAEPTLSRTTTSFPRHERWRLVAEFPGTNFLQRGWETRSTERRRIAIPIGTDIGSRRKSSSKCACSTTSQLLPLKWGSYDCRWKATSWWKISLYFYTSRVIVDGKRSVKKSKLRSLDAGRNGEFKQGRESSYVYVYIYIYIDIEDFNCRKKQSSRSYRNNLNSAWKKIDAVRPPFITNVYSLPTAAFVRFREVQNASTETQLNLYNTVRAGKYRKNPGDRGGGRGAGEAWREREGTIIVAAMRSFLSA